MSDSVFDEVGFEEAIESLKSEVQELYTSDDIPWVIGYSGGKDSTATLQIIWMGLNELDEEELGKPVHVIATDTLVENPVVAAWVEHSLDKIEGAAEEQGLPFQSHRLTPDLSDTFWVNLIGRGYPAPRPKFRWCTERLKINPSNQFIKDQVKEHGEAILALGTRKAESQKRQARMEEAEEGQCRDKLSPNQNLPNSLVYTPIEDWIDDDVWLFLMQKDNRWGISHKKLLSMYRGASQDNECPLVVDTTTPSCGDSRFGCWTCTMVEQDKSMSAMIQNDQEKEWMMPLLELRNELDVDDDTNRRDFRRMSGHVQLFHNDPIPGPYTQDAREYWLKRVLETQQWIRENGPEHVENIKLIRMEELREIRRIWVREKHEIGDNLPRIYEEITGEEFPGDDLDDTMPFGREELELLKEACDGDDLQYELIRELLDVELQHRTMARRAGLFEALEDAFERSFYEDEEDATERARAKKRAKDAAEDLEYEQTAIWDDSGEPTEKSPA